MWWKNSFTELERSINKIILAANAGSEDCDVDDSCSER
jgi:hypothetical protein